MMQRNIAFLLSILMISGLAVADGGERTIDCDAGHSLAKAINNSPKAITFNVSGTCYESVVIQSNDINIVGNNATISGELMEEPADVLTITGAKRIKVSGVTISSGNNGLHVSDGASVTLDNVVSKGNLTFGILVSKGAHVDISDVTITGNKGNGLNIEDSSSVSISNALNIIRNNGFGLHAQSVSSVFSQDAEMTITDNFAMGVHIVAGSNIFLNETTLDASRNFLRGVSVNSGSSMFAFNTKMTANDSFLLDGFAFANSIIDLDKDSTITSNRNGRDGLVLEGATLTTFVFITNVGPSITVTHNRANGIRSVLSSKMEIKNLSTLTSQNNAGVGLLMDDGSAANLHGATITDNAIDVSLSFASRVNSIEGNTIDVIQCDASSLIKGLHSCP